MALAFVMGIVLGLLYDFLRPFRRRAGKRGRAAMDVSYGCIAAGAAFLYAMAAPGGRIGIWELWMILAGFLSYLHTVSDRVYQGTDALCRVLLSGIGEMKKRLKKIQDTAKFYFHIVQK